MCLAESWVWQSPAPNNAVVPGEAVTPEVVQREKTREAMIGLTRRFAASGLSWHAGDPATITPTTQKVAEAFLRVLPAANAFPTMAPDGEGALLMVWERPWATFVLIIDDLRLHAVVRAGTQDAEYIDGVPFDVTEQVIPDEILNAIPAR